MDMDTIEARSILDNLLRWYREMTYAQLVAALVNKCGGWTDVCTPANTVYNAETRIGWSDASRTTIRVTVVVDDGDYGDQVCGGFVVDPRGQFIGE